MRYVILLALFGLALARPTKRYDGYKVLSITPQTEEQLALLRLWRRDNKFDFWLEPTVIGREVHMMVGPQHQTYIRAKLLATNTPHSLHIADVQKHIDDSFDEIEARRAARPEGMAWNYDDYNTYADYLTELNRLANQQCPAGFTCTTEDIGTSYENRIQRVLTLKMNNPGPNRYAIWYDSQVHAREWLSGATLMKVVQRIFTGTDVQANRFRNDFDWYFLPMENPDGYDYTWTGDRLWRKNRNPNAGYPACPGTDINRNFPYHWGQPGASANPCDDDYRGSGSGSERETQALNTYAGRIKGNLVAWINFHCYGQYWLLPWGDCTVPADHNSHQMPVANACADAIGRTYGTAASWQRGNSCQLLYANSGGIMDHMKATHGIRYCHAPELRGNSFVVPASEIQPSYTEVWNGLVAKLDQMQAIGLP